MSLTFRQLHNGEEMPRCQFILENRMQCYKGSVYEAKDDNTGVTETFCLAHARITQARVEREQTEPVKIENETDSNKLEDTKREPNPATDPSAS